ncbi:RIP metalloprotease RseP [Undibacterium sp. 14-3-2]|uniref:RIP metalloprotease RseP n=1 Tax=Undibacterium sp. 14-3-2 TaxID=2800129 RepID=UPI001907D429|nr:RIP metalloprotease RseP [Undibacterium sp. 14-3-2]MBK1890788.1 RIP metalloprotease RseP [Undibacterium sp. 14-3-2]
MKLIQTILAFIVTLGTLVTIHELGHYIAARLCGVKVLRFSVGMGRVIFSRKLGKDQTEWAISLLPLGGYVKMLDAREQDVAEIPPADLPREFCRQSVWKRIVIVAAGPVANFILAIMLYSALFVYGIPEPVAKIRVPSDTSIAYASGLRHGDVISGINGKAIQSWSEVHWELMQRALEKNNAEISVIRTSDDRTNQQIRRVIELPLKQLGSQDLEGDFMSQLGFSLARPPAVLGEILPDGPASLAGLKKGDLILRINGDQVLDGLAFTEKVNAAAGQRLTLHVKRNGNETDVVATPVADEVNGTKIGRLKIQMMLAPEMTIVQTNLIASIGKSAQKTWDTSIVSIKMLWKMVVGEVSLKNITGPLTIADYAGQTSRVGLISYLSFMALISISLGVMNLLPIPVLDGGHLLYYSLEVLTGKPVSERFTEIAQRAGVALLMAIMAVAFFNDIARLMS